MAQATSPSALQYLDKAMGGLKQLGLVPDNSKSAAAPIVMAVLSG